mmetsp:Transcript_28444/g.59828  ORF Transcript_28444/g.59828 Transcript_28444/m.59828 type:complete len:99 (-) Transcript_28444:3576-3872(-)
MELDLVIGRAPSVPWEMDEVDTVPLFCICRSFDLSVHPVDDVPLTTEFSQALKKLGGGIPWKSLEFILGDAGGDGKGRRIGDGCCINGYDLSAIGVLL